MLTLEELKKRVHYNPETGIFTWTYTNVMVNQKVIQGERADHISKGYYRIGINRIRYFSARLAWLYMTGEWPKYHVDHINGDPLDNRFVNLRDVTAAINIQNQRKPGTKNRSGYLGVSLNKKDGKYHAFICTNYQTKWLGRYDDPAVAYQAYLSAKRRLHIGCTI